MSIASKKASETKYWLRLLFKPGFRFMDKTSMEISRLIDLDQKTAVLLTLPLDSKWDWIKACPSHIENSCFFRVIRGQI